MPRVKRGKIHLKKRNKLLKAAKGYRSGRKNKIKLARIAVLKAGVYAYRDRKNKKRESRNLWLIKINAAGREQGLSYSKLIGGIKKAKIKLDRKILADLAENNPVVFNKIIEFAKQDYLKT
ncbi:MAG: large subunit ribosomal protein L20 [Parcubacteria group bacterium Athens1014_10]|nr:MAG: large subunit ribosomal protein L20 [Parcubacteria group bacterium Athens1014_10]TSD05244.1 MAG: large subunit ribosomal protein L20 [Parcubacteria group bacterium Athens0714_12]